jgi:predicted transcriptional regulator
MILETIELRPELQAMLEENAHREAKSISDMLNEALEYYFEAKQEEKLNKEVEAYEAIHAELWRTRPYQWVAFHNQQLIDHDTDHVSLYRRIHARYGRIAILIRQVREQPVEEIWWRSFRIEPIHE